MMVTGSACLSRRSKVRLRSARLGSVRPGLTLLALLAVGLSACDGDTLYDPAPFDPNVPGGAPDPASLVVRVAIDAPDRIELTDSMVVHIETFDADTRYGVVRAGYTLRIHDGQGGVPLVRSQEVTAAAVPGDTISATFVLHPDWITPTAAPGAFELELYGWSRTDDGRCRAAVPEASTSTFACETVGTGASAVTVGAARAAGVDILVVRGRTTPYPMSQVIVGDLQADTVRGRIFLSNRLSNRLHVFRPATFEWQGDVLVGSEPWGMHLNANADTLLVANSGGTSVSRVVLGATPVEAVGRRVHTRNAALFEIDLRPLDDSIPDMPVTVDPDSIAEAVRFLDFSDRPQYAVQDAVGRLLFSTRPTLAAPRGTVRIVTNQPGWEEHHTRILARLPQDATSATRTIAVLNADSIVPYWNGLIEVFDHPPGFPSQVIRSGVQLPLDALRTMAADPMSDVQFLAGASWTLDAVSFADTTYVATSRDRNWVAFGDGGEPTVGRVVLWHAPVGEISSRLTVADLVNNASERVRSIELNSNGTLGAARGAFGTYFFSRDLRLRGNVPEYVPGGAGAALHPEHPSDPAVSGSGSTATTLAFTATGDRAIRILDTVHYHERGRIPVRDDIVGPLRVTHPFASDNGGQGRNCQGPNCVVVKVFAATATGGILVADVLASDILPAP